jgi:hypothetical protein
MVSMQPIGGTELRDILSSMLLFATKNQDRASMTC